MTRACALAILACAPIDHGCDRPAGPGAASREQQHAAVQPTCPATGSAPAPQARGPARPNTALPGITIFPESREIVLRGRICIETGILEYLAVSREGKTYESLFELDCRPQHLHTALLLAGHTAGALAPELQGDFAPEATEARPEGAPSIPPPPSTAPARNAPPPSYLIIEVELQQPDGSWRRQPLETLLVNRATGKPPSRLRWAFTGSFFRRDEKNGEEYFIADVEKSLIALWFDPTALVNLAADMGNPYRSEDGGLEAAKANRPPKDTPVRLVLRPQE